MPSMALAIVMLDVRTCLPRCYRIRCSEFVINLDGEMYRASPADQPRSSTFSPNEATVPQETCTELRLRPGRLYLVNVEGGGVTGSSPAVIMSE